MRREAPDTIDELAEERYMYRLNGAVPTMLFPAKFSELTKRGLIIYNRDKASKMYFYQKDINFLPRFPGSEKKPHQMYKMDGSNHTFKLSKDNLLVMPTGIGSQRHNVLFKPFKKAIQRLFEAGITQHFPGANFFDNYSKKTFTVHDPKKELAPLSLEDLKTGFVIWLCAVLIAIFSFFGEILYYQCSLKIKRIQKRIKNNQKKKMRKMKKKLRHNQIQIVQNQKI